MPGGRCAVRASDHNIAHAKQLSTAGAVSRPSLSFGVHRVVEENGKLRFAYSLEHSEIHSPLRPSQQNGTVSDDDLQVNIDNLDG
jgi:hypothetical protein